MRASLLPELLAPAGDWSSLKAAVAQGADAVYFGVEAFNARLRAENFRLADLPEIMEWLHARGVKGFLTFNVLVFSDELEAAASLLLAAHRAGVDALIVQDLGLCLLAQQLVPSMALHASTQMSITSAAGVAQAAAAGCQRVVLARELALKDLRRLQNQLQDRDLSMPLEVFVHGALCVAYSGQCLTSESLGQRSANRGECAQACRLPYELIVDGEARDLGDQRYLLSPQDLSAWTLLPELVDLGIASFKIEGRLKDPTYVASVTQAYRQQLDGLEPDPIAVQRQLELGFSRGLSSGWLAGVNHRRLVHGRWSKKRGPVVGQLERVEAQGWLVVRTDEPLTCGQGLVMEVQAGAGEALRPPLEVGGRIMRVEPCGAALLRLRLGPGRLDLRGLLPGAPIWLTGDPQWQSYWQRQVGRETPIQERALRLRVTGMDGHPLILELLEPVPSSGARLSVRSSMPLQAARDQGLDRQRLERQIGRLGGSGWRLDHLEIDLPDALFLPLAELNRLRRELLDQLDMGLASCNAPSFTNSSPASPESDQRVIAQALEHCLPRHSTDSVSTDSRSRPPSLHVLVRSLEQLRALASESDGLPLAGVVADLEAPADLKTAVSIGRGLWPDGLRLAGPRITRPDERWSLEPLIRANPEGYLVRNADQLETLTPLAPCIGDFSLNTANPLTHRWYSDQWGLQRLTASYDLNLDQLLDLITGVDPGALEVTLHQHMPLFHMEHCLFCAFLSEGHDHTDCGRPCEHHVVHLRDRSGVEHPLQADLGCRNTLFNGRAQSGVEALPDLLAAGVRHLRLELLDEDGPSTLRRVRLYAQALTGEIPSQAVWRRERIDHRLGVTRGSLRAERPERTSQLGS
ncbi:peptidase U32 [Synechococcus sp. BS56D]|uniref:peptidase U32 family protein n=1 Tax=Synechococcus sp. BS56D TaxID=2055944 RepID=UPI00103A933D|nr:U32 family peptidase [Synechococcus sp. BS56D]TCD58580.1 peptidase U32 [Synechococcus sp. BS56D]